MTPKTPFKPFAYSIAPTLLLSLLHSPLALSDDTVVLAPVKVEADLRQSQAEDMPVSITVMDSTELQDAGATHTDDVLLSAPNVNVSNQNARVKHIQVRGMGERDEYTGAPNASVGLAIDDIDFSGLGGIGNLFDVQQVEILRGPQNTRYGQSAIGGLINIQSNDPTPYRESLVETSIGQYGHKELGVMTSGPVSDKKEATQYRIAVFKHQSDGFYQNETLNRKDTNGKDELTLRGKLRMFATANTTVDLTLLHADFNDGYDAWSRDNTFTTRSNQPGNDNQLSNAASMKVTYEGNTAYNVISTTSLSNTDALYNYDGDWLAKAEQFYENQKHRRHMSQDLRFQSKESARIFNNSTDWLIGAYASNMDESNYSDNYYAGSTELIDSDFNHQKLAVYSQLDQHVSSKQTMTYGLRVEHNRQTFKQTKKTYSDQTLTDDFSPDETLWGGSIHYKYRYNPNHMAFAGVTRGYKAGGFNAGSGASTNVTYDAETLLNYEVGLKSNYLNNRLQTATTVFYMDRNNPQFDGYSYDSAGEWIFYKENLDAAQNYGLETSFDWQATYAWQLFGSLGLLFTEVEGTPANSNFTMSGRDQAHAPNYQFHLGTQYRAANGFFARTEVRGMDSYYFDNVNDGKTGAYQIINARIGYEAKDWETYVWGNNLTDERYATRGFKFDHYDGDGVQEYIRLGDPRQFGATLRIHF
ncbi:Pesticin receptor [Hydrogenovibrio crunogenus]|uniref:Pesticin receptor n=1 Tax=Hydrogenovibrio crunogenus TaxID=39765 RepID=A0A4P7P1V0_9GAMM|nr:TonB-dependent receptor [Hydrogenovibrio crunogenus]QBZ84111.1 Pesticin receptor [Hydrogenovibrio crunogenus]